MTAVIHWAAPTCTDVSPLKPSSNSPRNPTRFWSHRLPAVSLDSMRSSMPRYALNAVPSMASAALVVPVKLLKLGVCRMGTPQ